MMPAIDPGEERRKKRGRAAALIGSGTIIVSSVFQPGWWILGTDPKNWVLFAAGTVASTAVAASGDLPRSRARVSGRGTGRGSGPTGHGRDDDQGPAGAAAHRWRVLAMVSRLMPRSAGARWLAEAESLLSEIAPVRRGAAIRSYLLTAPRLAVAMWVRELLRLARLGPRRPG
jgi:hypothetical protein